MVIKNSEMRDKVTYCNLNAEPIYHLSATTGLGMFPVYSIIPTDSDPPGPYGRIIAPIIVIPRSRG